eukprot:scaffold11020_cov66-Cyclotella_meneghiniana.AAC.3
MDDGVHGMSSRSMRAEIVIVRQRQRPTCVDSRHDFYWSRGCTALSSDTPPVPIAAEVLTPFSELSSPQPHNDRHQ